MDLSNRAVLCRQSVDVLEDPLGRFALLQHHPRVIEVRASDAFCSIVREAEHTPHRTLGTFRRLQSVQATVYRDAVDPCAHGRFAPEFAHALVHFHEDILGHLLRILPVLQIVQAEVEHHAHMAVVHFAESGVDGQNKLL